MKRETIVGLVIVLAISSLSFAKQPEYKPGSILVRFTDPNASTVAKNNIINTVLKTVGNPVKREYSVVKGLALVQLPADINVESAIASLKQSSSVAYAVPDYKREVFLVPNDTSFGSLWAMRNTGQTGGKTGADIGAVQAWNFSTGAGSVVVAVTDTGVDYTHTDLAANMWHNPNEIPGNGIDDDGDGYVDDYYGVDTGDNDGNPMDDSAAAGHGTHVSGTIGAVGNNNRGVTGVCWNVRIMAVKIADSNGDLWDSAAIRGIQYAVSKGTKVINASWGGSAFDQALYDAIASAGDSGVLFVAAAGNSNANGDASPLYPAAFNLDNIISVMATDDTDQRSYYSNYGLMSVDLGAPGGAQQYEHDPRGILSTLPGNQYDYYQGTSMASPHVAGACALLLSIDSTLTYSQVKQILLNTVDKTLPGLCVSGGRLNLAAAAQEAAVDTTPPTPNPPQWAAGAAPKATGRHTATMQAAADTDRSGVEYYFECVNNDVNSGWTANTLYSFTTLDPNTTYGFHFKARDKSGNHNQTAWSTTEFTTTSATVDNLPPFPDPPQWATPPKANPQTKQIRMTAATGYDESAPVQYQFSYQYKTNPEVILPWQSSNLYYFTPPSPDPYIVYNFRFHVRDANGNETDEWSPIAYARMFTGSRVLSVPIPYLTIQSAIDAAAPNSGDIVEVSPGVYDEYNITFNGKAITVRSSDPTNPAIVDCHGEPGGNSTRRGFIFNSGEGANSILYDITIINGIVSGTPGGAGLDGLAASGGGILCGLEPGVGGVHSSPTIRNCTITNCRVYGGSGGTGGAGNADTRAPGGKGGNSGEAHGGGIYVSPGSNPFIQNCTISNCATIAGSGGNGGAGGDGNATTPGTNGGAGGNVTDFSGGGIYVQANGNPSIIGGTVSDCFTIFDGATPGAGGRGGNGSANGQAGRNGSIIGLGNGAGIFFNMNSFSGNINISAVNLTSNTAYNNGGGAGFGPADGKTVTMSDCQFSSNYAGNGDESADINEDGGGLWFANASGTATLQLSNCTFSDNIAERTGGGLKGGLLNVPPDTNTILQINGSSFAGNGAQEGGGIYLDRAVLSLTESTLTGNSASEGGGINGYSCSVDIRDSQLSGNKALSPGGMGGGVAFWNTTGDINNSVLKNNAANSFGGAAFMDGWTTSPLQFTNCLIVDNNAFYEGGALSCNLSGWAKLINCTMVGNSATSGSYGTGGAISSAENFAWVQLENCILWENLALNGPQIAVGTIFGSLPDGAGPFADVDVSNCDVEGGQDGVYIEDPYFTAVWWLAGNITDDPLFVDVDVNAPGYYLSQVKAGQLVNSPCVDAGSFDASELKYLIGETLTTRTDLVEDANMVDIGYHYNNASTPGTPGTAKQYNLNIEVYKFDPNEGGHGRLTAQSQPGSDNPFNILDPNTIRLSQATQVNLVAAPDPCFKVQYWSGTDNDGSTALTNAVTMNDDKRVVVAFAPDGLYYLTVSVVKGEGNVTPLGRTLHRPGEVVTLTAIPTNPSDKIDWTGTDDDVSQAQTNTVTMTTHKNVTVEFYTPRILHVGGDVNYPTIQMAIDDANDRDIVLITPGTYNIVESSQDHSYLLIYRNITLTSSQPENPELTVITGKFQIYNVSRKCVIQGLTISGNVYWDNDLFTDPNTEVYLVDPTAAGTDGPYPGDTPGAGMTLNGAASPTVRNVRFVNCWARGIHGADGAGGEDPLRPGTTGNGGPGGRAMGGGAYCGPNGSPLFVKCSFTACLARGGDAGNGAPAAAPGEYPGHGGAWGDKNWPGWDYGPMMDYWRYTGCGGAIYCDERSTAEFINCDFTNNTVIGGSCGISGSPPFVMGWPYSHYKIQSFGGAIYAETGSAPTFTNCNFTDNMADPNGWPINLNDNGNTVAAYPITSYGGAIAFETGASPLFTGCTFTSNLAAAGGAVYCDEAYPEFDESTFINNSALHGGGVMFSQGYSIVNRCVFTGNEGTYAAAQGGAISALGANAEIADCNINSNRSAGSGGGIYISGREIDGNLAPGGNSVLIKNCLITDNTADLGGGGIAAVWYSDPNIVNCTIFNNSVGGSGGGLFSSYGSYVNVLNCIIWDNTSGIGSSGRQIAVGGGETPSGAQVRYSDVQDSNDPSAWVNDINALDFVICFDTTGSMAGDISAVRTTARQIVNAIAAQYADYRLGLVDFRDYPDGNYGDPGDWPYRDRVRFTTSADQLIAGLQPMAAGGGADGPEAIYTALMHCIDANALAARLTANGNTNYVDSNSPGLGDWRKGGKVMRVILLLTDSLQHDPENYTNYVLNDIITAANGRDAIHIIPVLIRPSTYTQDALRPIAIGTSGMLITATDSNAVTGAVLDAIGLLSKIPTPIDIGPGGTINWDPNTFTWAIDSHNINADPLFIGDFFLSQIAAGQPFTSPCVDAGSADANSPGIDLANYTTRTDSVADQGVVDMGYHYPLFAPPQYRLDFNAVVANGLEASDLEPNSGLFNWFTTVPLRVKRDPGSYQVLWTGTDNDDANGTTNTVLMDGPKAVTVAFVSNTCTLTAEVIGGHGTISASPQGPTYPRNTVVELTAIPDAGYRVKGWTGTDNDNLFTPTNTVKMSGDKHVTVEFEVPSIKTVPGDFTTIEGAVNAARPGDIVSVASGVYNTPDLVINKEITVTSTNPDDPCVVAMTVIDGIGIASQGVTFGPGATGQTVLNGITIANCGYGFVPAVAATVAGAPGPDGGRGSGAGIVVTTGASPTIKNCVIRNCQITGGNAGAGGNADATTPAGHGGWGGWARGAGVYVASNASPTFINCTVRDCNVTGGNGGNGGNFADGGGDAGPGGNWSDGVLWQTWGYIGDYRFYSGYGAGVFCDANSSATFIACNIINNTASGGMSGIGGNRATGVQIPMPGTAYRLPGYGGGVYCGGNSNVTFIDCNIKGNLAPKPDTTYHTDPYLGHGGGIAFENTAFISLTGCNISDNISAVGGGMFWHGGAPTIRDCNISANIAYVGGGAYGKDGASLIEDCNVYRNFAGISSGDVDVVAGQGGGIFSESMDANIIDSRFVDNTTDASGAAIYFHGPVSGGDNTANVTNCLMIGNTAGRDGGGVSANWNVSVNLANCTLHSNNATGSFGDPNGHTGLGGGLYCAYGAATNIIDSILWRNDANLGPEIAVDTGFELDQHCGRVNVSYSDVRGGSAGTYVGESGNCSAYLNWAGGNIGVDPKFVSEIISDYRLQQVAAGQTQAQSPCVDAGSNSASALGLGLYTTRTDDVPDRGKVDMGYHYLVEQPCRFVDIGNKILTAGRTKWMKDGIIDWTDFAVLADSWLSGSCSPVNGWCKGADLTFDNLVNWEDLALISECWLAADTTPPSPNPSDWALVPTGVWPNKVKMSAVSSVDTLWGLQFDSTHPVQYQFDCTSGNGHGSGWQYDANYIDTGLQSYTEYAYRVRARDLAGNTTNWSSVQWTVITPDSQAPTPNPMTWNVEPHAVSATSISMTATTASDDSGGIQYEFEINEPNIPNFTSGWRDDPNYTITGLNPAGPYCFRAKARDTFDNETGWSDQICVSNLGDVTPPTPDPNILWVSGNWNIFETAYGFSGEFTTTTGTTRWWHRVVADVTGITDDSGGPLEVRFICNNNSFSSLTKVAAPIIIGQPPVGNILGGHTATDTYQVFWNGNTIVYDVYINTGSGLGGDYTWRVCVYDPTLNSACSNSVEIAGLYIGPPR